MNDVLSHVFHQGRPVAGRTPQARAMLVAAAKRKGFTLVRGKHGGVRWVFAYAVPAEGALMLAGRDGTPVQYIPAIPCPLEFATRADAAYAALAAVGLIGEDGNLVRGN